MENYLRFGWLKITAETCLNYSQFIKDNTSVLSPPLVPEVRLHLAHESLSIWQKTEEELGEIGLPPPFWAFAWAGGQALARYVLDHPDIVREKKVIDIASGSGLVAIAALKAGAASVLAADIDDFAVAAMQLNSKLNAVTMDITSDNLMKIPAGDADVILVGDLFYEKTVAEMCFNWLESSRPKTVLIGDPGRAYLPQDKLVKTATYAVPVSRDLEDAEIKQTSVWTLR